MHSLATILVLIWIVFWVYWIISAMGAKKGTLPNARQFIGLRVIILVLAVAEITAYDHLSQSYKNHFMGRSDVLLVVGLILFLLGILLAIWARLSLAKNWGMPMTQKENPELVTSGPYHYVRHPIYSGILLMMLGSTIDINSYWLFIFIVVAIYFVYAALAEEKLMLKQFPKTYPSYKARTKMLIPFLF